MSLNNYVVTTFILAVAVLYASQANAQDSIEVPHTFELEKINMDYTRVLLDVTASSGEYRATTIDDKTLVQLPIPEKGRFEVWVRYRGLPLVLKSSNGKILGYLEANDSSEWKWASFGIYDTHVVGNMIDIYAPFSDRNKKESLSGVDQVVLAPLNTNIAVLNKMVIKAPIESLTVPDADIVLKSAPVSAESEDSVVVNVSFDWRYKTGQTAERQYSLNIFNGYDPTVANNPDYIKNITYMVSPVLRYHNMSGMLSDPSTNRFGWYNSSSKTWNAARISAALDPLEGLSSERLITIGRWPRWMDLDKDGMLDNDKYHAFAQLCAQLVHLLNIEQKRGIQYFEITNERDMVYWVRQMKKGQSSEVEELAKIYNLAAIAMKKVDSSIKVGGPAATRSDLVRPLQQFAAFTIDNLDFLSYHTYASGDPTELDVNVYNRTENIGRDLSIVRNMLDDLSPDHHIELHINEYNIFYTHKVKGKQMTNNISAVFDALVFVQMVKYGADVGNAWNAADNIYGKMNRGYKLRPSAHVFHYFNTMMTGDEVATSSDQSNVIVPFAVEHKGERNGVLINRSKQANTVKVKLVGISPKDTQLQFYRISAKGLDEFTGNVSELTYGMVMPPNSVVFFSIK
jgi:hypothetical protein